MNADTNDIVVLINKTKECLLSVSHFSNSLGIESRQGDEHGDEKEDGQGVNPGELLG
jgi:hypothetical protein